MTENNDMKWFERDPLPRWVVDKDGETWNLYKEPGDIASRGLYRQFNKCPASIGASALEMCYGPCVPLVVENGQAEPPSSDALTVPAGELKRALELRMGEHAGRIRGVVLPETGGNYNPEAAVKAGDMARLALAIDPNKNKRWALTPIRDGEGDA